MEPEQATYGTTDISLTDNGRRLAEPLRPVLARQVVAGLGDRATIEPDLVEWNYGKYEGLTPKQIHETAPDWLIFRDGCPGGEAPGQVGARVDRVIARARTLEGDVALFAHGQVLHVHVLAAPWLRLAAGDAQHPPLVTGALKVLGYDRSIPALKV